MGKRGVHPGKAITYRIEGTCYICTSHCHDTRGYPLISINGHMKGLHRHIWEQTNDRRIPEKMLVRHTCGNLACINPSHLKLASRADLARELEYSLRGNKHPCVKLNVEQVLDIRNNQELSCSELAKKYGVTNSNISVIRRGKSWKHINVKVKDNPYFGYSGIMRSQAKLSESDVKEIRANKMSTLKELAERYGVTLGLISHVRRGRVWKHLNEVAPPSPSNYAKGERTKLAKLTKDQVKEIRADKTSSQNALARRFGVSQPTICRIKQGKSWKHLTEA